MPTTKPAYGSVARLPLAISLLALVIALSGTAVAATLAANSVGSKQLKNNAVKTAKIKNNAVTGAKIQNGSIAAADLAAGTLPANDVVYNHAWVGNQAPPSTQVAGLVLSHSCLFLSGDWEVGTLVTPAAGAGDLDLSFQTMATAGGSTDAHTDHLDNQVNFGSIATAATGALATTSFEGMARAGNGPWVRIYAEMAVTDTDDRCNVRGFLSVQR